MHSNSWIDMRVRPDISVTAASERYLRFSNLVLALELKNNLDKHEDVALGALRSYLNHAFAAQPDRNIIFGAITDLRQIFFVRLDRTAEPVVISTGREPLLMLQGKPVSLADKPTAGFKALCRMLAGSSQQLGCPDSPTLKISLAVKGVQVAPRERLGAGGSSDVFAANLDAQEVAVKVWRQGEHGLFSHEDVVLRALEARAVSGVPRCLHYSSAGPSLVLQPCGIPVMTQLAEQAFLPPDKAGAICADALDALRQAHAAGYVHCDVRPHNMVWHGTRAYLVDWALARQSGGSVGKLGVAAFCSSAALRQWATGRLHSFTPFDDLEAIAYSLQYLMSGGLALGLDDPPARIISARDPASLPARVAAYLKELEDQRKRPGDPNYQALMYILHGTQPDGTPDKSLNSRPCQVLLRKSGTPCGRTTPCSIVAHRKVMPLP